MLKIDNLPFYWRLAEDTSNNIVSSNMEFIFEWDEKLSLLKQKRNSNILEALHIIYQQEDNIGYLQEVNTIARSYGSDFLVFLKKELKKIVSKSANILEIGCGGCVILEQLKNDGHKVLGVDSSPFAVSEGKKRGIKVINDFFPSPKITESFDLIFCVDVLEHIDDYTNFINEQISRLNQNGLIVVNVPDATESILIGDISLAMHQHLNYFTTKSLHALLKESGLVNINIETSNYGGSLYACGKKAIPRENIDNAFLDVENNATKELDLYEKKSKKNISKLRAHIFDMAKLKKSIGFYVPLRALPYLCPSTDINFRFFDDTPHWYGKKFDGTDTEIENMDDLVYDPVDVIYIMSLTFGKTIKTKILSSIGCPIEIYLLEDFCRFD